MDKGANKMQLLWNFTGNSLRLKNFVEGFQETPYPSAVAGILVITQGYINWYDKKEKVFVNTHIRVLFAFHLILVQKQNLHSLLFSLAVELQCQKKILRSSTGKAMVPFFFFKGVLMYHFISLNRILRLKFFGEGTLVVRLELELGITDFQIVPKGPQTLKFSFDRPGE